MAVTRHDLHRLQLAYELTQEPEAKEAAFDEYEAAYCAASLPTRAGFRIVALTDHLRDMAVLRASR